MEEASFFEPAAAHEHCGMDSFGRTRIGFRRAARFFVSAVCSVAVILLLLVGFFNLPAGNPRPDVAFGVTFSSRFARDLGLDPGEALPAIFSDLGVRKVRIPVYWDTVEASRGVFDFSDIDWQLDMARAYGATVIVALGQKVPRWPECHIPEWAKDNESLRNEAALRFIRKTIERYASRPEIVMWQIENEPFLSFGACPPLSGSILDREIAAARAADPMRPILTTDSGELSLWVRAASRGDIFGTTLYRRVWNERFGYITYPIGPRFFRAKEALVRILTAQETFMVIELQAEPWGPGSFPDLSSEEQSKTMNPEKFRDTIEYARRVGFPDVYLWGAEWWYWLRESRGDSSMWEAARDVFRSR